MSTVRTLTACLLAVLAMAVVAPRGDVGRADGAAQAAPTLGAQAAQDTAETTPLDVGGPGGRMALTGDWTLRSDRFAHGALKGFQAGTFPGSAITVPDVPNAGRVTGPLSSESFRGTIAWYRTSFTVPENGDYAIRFESINHRATVWVDGVEVAHHLGEYLPFEANVSLDSGREHTLVVRADYRDPLLMKATGWHRTWFNFGGINREVTIRKLSASEVTAPTIQTHLQPDGSAIVDLSVHVKNLAPARSVRVTGLLSHLDSNTTFEFPTLDFGAGQTRVLTTSIVVPSPALWAPSSPNLYDLTIAVPGESSYSTRTGLRELRKVGTQLLLNGTPITLHGASIHEDAHGRGDALTGADMDELVRELQAIGANATRAQHPLSEALMERLDAAGIMVWMGIGPVDAPGAWTSNTPALREQAKRRVRTTLYQLQTHPAIIAWNLANEVAGNGHPGGQASYIDQMARELKRRDPGRLVALDIWGVHPPKVAGPMYSAIDAIGDTNYIGWYSDTYDTHPQLAAAIRSHIAGFKRVFPNKILAVTEFGAEANGRNATDSPGGYQFQASLLKLHIQVYKTIPGISGMLVWNLRDFAVSPAFAGGSIHKVVKHITITRGLNQKGLFTYGGTAKPSVAVVQSLFAAP